MRTVPLAMAFLVVLAGAWPAKAQVAAEHNFAGGVTACEACHGAGGDSAIGSIPRLNGQQAGYIIFRVRQLLDLPADPSGSGITELAARLDAEALSHIADHFAGEPPMTAKPGSLAAAGKRIYDEGVPSRFVMACRTCHGPNGEGHGGTPRLMGQHALYLDRQLRLFRSSQRDNRLMHFAIFDLGDDDIDALVSYLAGD